MNIKESDSLTIMSRQSDVSSLYNRASVVLNLSDPQCFIETFGLTALEAMSAGLPVIVPTVGGIAEMVEDGKNGYKIDVRDLDVIESYIRHILSDKDLYRQLASNALAYSKSFDEESMIGKIADILKVGSIN